MAGLVVQLRRDGRYGTSLWTLPGHPLSGDAATKLKPAVDRFAEFDAGVLSALRRAVATTNEEHVRIGAVLEQMGWTGAEHSKSRECSVAQALIRLEKRKQASSVGTYCVRRWGVAGA
jgi:hypothetical protein